MRFLPKVFWCLKSCGPNSWIFYNKNLQLFFKIPGPTSLADGNSTSNCGRPNHESAKYLSQSRDQLYLSYRSHFETSENVQSWFESKDPDLQYFVRRIWVCLLPIYPIRHAMFTVLEVTVHLKLILAGQLILVLFTAT